MSNPLQKTLAEQVVLQLLPIIIPALQALAAASAGNLDDETGYETWSQLTNLLSLEQWYDLVPPPPASVPPPYAMPARQEKMVEYIQAIKLLRRQILDMRRTISEEMGYWNISENARTAIMNSLPSIALKTAKELVDTVVTLRPALPSEELRRP